MSRPAGMGVKEACRELVAGAARVISEEELEAKLRLGRPLRVKLGVDPTAPDIHLGHTVALQRLRRFQDLGHQAVLIIGDFTAMIGDPTGRSATRPQLAHEDVMANARTYREQAFKILDPARTETVCNGDWFGRMTLTDVIRLNSRVTLQQMLQREDFRDRMERELPIGAHEIQYPILQGWDSVMVRADVELGGSDQLFNILVGRDLQRQEGMEQQVAILLPILEGLDGVQKMSKSLGNHIGVSDSPGEMFGKLMSISDPLMHRYSALLLGREIDPGLHPMEAKKALAGALVARFHSAAAAGAAREQFELKFSRRRVSEADWPEVRLAGGERRDLISLVVAAYAAGYGETRSRSEARRLIESGSVRVGEEKLTDPAAAPVWEPGTVLRLDKRRAVRLAD